MCLYFFFFSIEIELTYNTMLVSGVLHTDLTCAIHYEMIIQRSPVTTYPHTKLLQYHWPYSLVQCILLNSSRTQEYFSLCRTESSLEGHQAHLAPSSKGQWYLTYQITVSIQNAPRFQTHWQRRGCPEWKLGDDHHSMSETNNRLYVSILWKLSWLHISRLSRVFKN